MRSSRHVSGSVSEGGGRDGLRPNEVGSAELMKFSVCKKKGETTGCVRKRGDSDVGRQHAHARARAAFPLEGDLPVNQMLRRRVRRQRV